MANNILDLRMGVDAKLTDENISKLDVGALSYSVDKQNLYIDALKEDKITAERQMINADKAYAIRDKDEDVVAEPGVGKYSFRENEKTITLGNNSHAEGLGRKAQAYITGSANSTSYTYEFIDGGDFNQSDGHMNVADMDQINTPLVWVYKDNENNYTYATGYSMSHNSKGTITLSNTLSKNVALNKVIVDVYSGGYSLGDNSHVEGMYSKTLSESSHAEGVHTRTTGVGAHAEGYRTTAEGKYSHAEGCYSEANGDYSHAENYGRAEGKSSHSEGFTDSSIIGDGSWYLGGAEGDYSHNEGYQTLAQGNFSHSEGYYSWATAWGAHAEGTRTEASSSDSHAEGYETFANGLSSHAEGARTISEGDRSHSEGFSTIALGDYSHAEGVGDRKILYITGEANTVNYTISNDYYNEFNEIQINDIVFFSLKKIDLSDGNTPSYATKTKNIIAKIISIDYENKIITLDKTLSTNNNAVENDEIYVYTSYAKGTSSHVEGNSTIALGASSHAEGQYTQAIGKYSHASGLNTIASGNASASFGKYNQPYYKTYTEEPMVFLMGEITSLELTYGSSYTKDLEKGLYTLNVEGSITLTPDLNADEVNSLLNGKYYFEGLEQTTSNSIYYFSGFNNSSGSSFVYPAGEGYTLTESQEDYLFTIGNGTSSSSRSNIFEIDYNNSVNINGDTVINGQAFAIDSTSTDNTPKELATVERVQQIADSIITDVWYRGSTPPTTVKQAKLLWIRYDANDEATYGKGVLYYFNPALLLSETLTDAEVVNVDNWIPMSAIYT